jgi:hypothetical protein
MSSVATPEERPRVIESRPNRHATIADHSNRQIRARHEDIESRRSSSVSRTPGSSDASAKDGSVMNVVTREAQVRRTPGS